MAAPLFAVEPLEEAPRQAPQQNRAEQAALGAIMLALKSLSQRAIVAVASLVNLAMVASVFWLFLSIPSPSTNQIIWGGMYAAFILMLVALNTRRGALP